MTVCTSPLEGEGRERKAGEKGGRENIESHSEMWEKRGVRHLGEMGLGFGRVLEAGFWRRGERAGAKRGRAAGVGGRARGGAAVRVGVRAVRVRVDARACVETWLSSRMAERARATDPQCPNPRAREALRAAACALLAPSSGLRTACALGAPSVRPSLQAHTHTHLGSVTWRQLASRTQKLGAASAASVSSSAAASADPATGAKHVASALDVPASMPREAPKV